MRAKAAPDPRWACPRRASGVHRWRPTEIGGTARTCLDCGAVGEVAPRDGNRVLQPGQARISRSRRARGVPRARVIKVARLTMRERLASALANPPIEGIERPRTRGDCSSDERPCPWVSCKHHLFLDINPITGTIKLNFPDLEPWELAESCALDVADRGEHTLEEVGLLTNLTRERIRQLEVRGLLTVKASPSGKALR